MAGNQKTSIATLVAGTPVPNIPTTNDPRQLAVFFKQLIDWIRSLMQTVSSGVGSSQLYYVTPSITDIHETEFDPKLGDIAWFNNGSNFPAGKYAVGYDSGALDYGSAGDDVDMTPSPTGVYRLNVNSGFRYFIVFQNLALYNSIDPGHGPAETFSQDYDQTGTHIVGQIMTTWMGMKREWPGGNDDTRGFDASYGQQYGVETSYAGQEQVIIHSGGKIGMRLYDYPRHDNEVMPGGSAPRFYLRSHF